MSAWAPLPRPAYLDAKSPKGALIAYHAEKADSLRESLRGLRDEALLEALRSGEDVERWAEAYDAGLGEMKWEEGSIAAMLRDRLQFHEQTLDYLTED